jgi:hypothetical protein
MYVGGWVSDKINQTHVHTQRERGRNLCVFWDFVLVESQKAALK